MYYQCITGGYGSVKKSDSRTRRSYPYVLIEYAAQYIQDRDGELAAG